MINSEILRTLQQLEVELHQAATRQNLSRLNELLHSDLEEFGRSGRRYSHSEVLSECTTNSEHPDVVSKDFKLKNIGEGIVLLTYISAHKDVSGDLHRNTLRSSLWLLGDNGGKKMRFH
jgi:hypothetical protein